MNDSWKQDPRIKNMDKRKLDLLDSFAGRISQMPKNQLFHAVMELNLEAQKSGIQFSDQETELLAEILTGKLSPDQKQKLDTLRLLSRRLAGQK
ncbi:MAG: hypothetical protein Q4F29_10580 [Lachnospiraceae bacterium]|nr:hypothetical protein [Lachnospiraceae bacterium]